MQASLQHSPAELSHAFGPVAPHPHGAPPNAGLLPNAGYQYRLSSSPPLLNAASEQQQQQQQGIADPSGVALLQVAQSASSSSSSAQQHQHKRKDDQAGASVAIPRKRRRHEGADPSDEGPNGGPKHWTDEEKTRLFRWVMGPGRDLQFNSLRASKNGCLRECAQQVFGGRKTYQALKGAFERSFAVFRQIYQLESVTAHMADRNVNVVDVPAARMQEYERRIQAAREKGVDTGTLNARTIDQWHRLGWYDLFYTRYHGDPATTKPSSHRERPNQSVNDDRDEHDDEHGRSDLFGNDGSGGLDDAFDHPHTQDEPLTSDAHLAYLPAPPTPEPRPAVRAPSSSSSLSHAMPPSPSAPRPPPRQLQPQTQLQPKPSAMAPPPPPPPPPQTAATLPSPSSSSTLSHLSSPASTVATSVSALSDDAPPAVSPSNLVPTVAAILKTQSQVIDYIKKRDAREEEETRKKVDGEQLQKVQMKAEFATKIVSDPNADVTVKAAAADYLKRLFLSD
ncbi:hypothetical protein PUNSTDRAFT_108871 [Punctularia strigosozonata HHB-11173 SS5]|uniref:Uncharacterized protein n=1 Tax=Punctularia strigosozonata (strain HHB-11173) TaxID=741275 RepID=R7S1C8_PUNST|nr:uncharacterized protein PUNSTDRAFT_108871 [Punctularia strigosozonata HHB-11173 SS5]EIN04028.1 hypothetical protein PUNSTDRAFT_108871 [Punctularia strigosozonata HHB-11173 SS5]